MLTFNTEKEFNDFRFGDLNYNSINKHYFTMNRVSANESKIVVNVSPNHIYETETEYALILDANTVVFLARWQVDYSYYGVEVLLMKEAFIPEKSDDFSDTFLTADENDLTWEFWLETARMQESNDKIVRWSKREY